MRNPVCRCCNACRRASLPQHLIVPVTAHAPSPVPPSSNLFNSTSSKYFISAIPPTGRCLTSTRASAGNAPESPSAFTQMDRTRARSRFIASCTGSWFYTFSPHQRGCCWQIRRALLPKASSGTPTTSCKPWSPPSTLRQRHHSALPDFNNGSNGPANHRYFQDYGFYQSHAAKGYALEGVAMRLLLSTARACRRLRPLPIQARSSAPGRRISTPCSIDRGAFWLD